MKNKKIIYVLLPLVVIIWGAIIFRIINYYFDKDSSTIINNDTPDKKVPENIVDTFSLLLNYSDPFLKSEVQPTFQPIQNTTQIIPAKNNATNNKKTVKENAKIDWPTIVFCGIIKNKASTKTYSIIKINGVEHIMGIGDTYSKVRMENVYKDSVVVSYMNTLKTFVNSKP